MTNTKPHFNSVDRRHRAVPTPEIVPLSAFISQAEVYCEQAREAARLRRFSAALGLFATAKALYRHVCAQEDHNTFSIACEKLQAVELEAAVYGELARGVARKRS